MKYVLIALFSWAYFTVNSQSVITFKPGPDCGKDASVTNTGTVNDGSMPSTIPVPSRPTLRVEAWTASALGSLEHDWRSLIDFVELKSIKSASVQSAKLILYSYPDFPHSNGGQAESNASEVYRIIEPWNEDEVTWINQPDTDLDFIIDIPRNNDYDLIEVDVTDMVQKMIDDPENSHGFLLKQQDESPYGSMDFASSDYQDYNRAPELILITREVEYYNDELGLLFNNKDTAICINTTIGISSDVNEDRILSYLWSNGEITRSIQINQPGLYGVIIETVDCIFITDTILITLEDCTSEGSTCEFFVPEAFTPNGDSNNDHFGIESQDYNCFIDFELRIFNRWGNLVFYSRDAEEKWGGFIKSSLVIPGVYLYYITYTNSDSNSIQKVYGDVTVVY